MRRRNLLLALAAVLGTGAVAAVAVPAVARSELASTVTRVAGTAPAPLRVAPLPGSVRPLWSAPALEAGGAGAGPAGSTVVVPDGHGLSGRDPSTGTERWTYRRGDARLCAWAARDGVVVAAFARAGECRHLIALDQDTGQRKWYRTVTLTGGPGDVTLSSSPGVVVARSAGQLVAVDTVTGLDRWTDSIADCRPDRPLAGALGVVAVYRCAGAPSRLVLHDAFGKERRWSVNLPGGTDPLLLDADDVIAVALRGAARSVLAFYDRTGRPAGSVPAPAGVRSAVRAGAVLALSTPTSTVGVALGRRSVLWSTPAGGPATPEEDRVLVPVGASLRIRDASTGAELGTVTVSGGGVPAGAGLARLGGLLLVSTPTAVTVYG